MLTPELVRRLKQLSGESEKDIRNILLSVRDVVRRELKARRPVRIAECVYPGARA